MSSQSFFDKVREWIGGIGWTVFLWSIRMTQDEYLDKIMAELRAELDKHYTDGIAVSRKEYMELRAENEAMSGDVDQYRSDMITLHDELAALRAELDISELATIEQIKINSALLTENERLTSRNMEIEEYFGWEQGHPVPESLASENERLTKAVEEAETLFRGAYLAPMDAADWLEKYAKR